MDAPEVQQEGFAQREPNPRRVAAGRRNRALRGPLSEAARQQLRAAALRDRPWEQATGPRTAAGRAQAARNGKRRQIGPLSVREMRAELAAARSLLHLLRATRQQVDGTNSP
jgi:hypothetical protein